MRLRDSTPKDGLGQPSDQSSIGSRVHFGTSSFSSKDWLGVFYPPGTQPSEFLTFYAQHFDTVEVDSTYYRIPSAEMVESWAAKTPDGFLIAAKFPRSIVHGGEGAQPNAEAVLTPDSTYRDRDEFLNVMSKMGSRLGPLVLQFPYFNKETFPAPDEFYSRLDAFLEDLPDGFLYAVEIRNRNWLTPEFAALCRSHGAALVLIDYPWMPHGDEVITAFDPITASFSYLRLIGNRKEIETITQTWGKEVIDQKERLNRWAAYLVELARHEVDIFVYVNNHFAGHAPATARRLREKYFAMGKGGPTPR